MEKEIIQLIKTYPKLKFLLRDPSFVALSEVKQRYILDMVEDARFWQDIEVAANPEDGFKFLAATIGMERAQQEAEDRELKGKAREEFLQPHQDLFTQFNPYSGRTNDR